MYIGCVDVAVTVHHVWFIYTKCSESTALMLRVLNDCVAVKNDRIDAVFHSLLLRRTRRKSDCSI